MKTGLKNFPDKSTFLIKKTNNNYRLTYILPILRSLSFQGKEIYMRLLILFKIPEILLLFHLEGARLVDPEPHFDHGQGYIGFGEGRVGALGWQNTSSKSSP